MSANLEQARRASARHVFIDTEFTSRSRPERLSIALVADDGRECYVELAVPPWCVNDFMVRAVLPEWGLVPGRAASTAELGPRVDAWLSSLGDTAIDVVYDFEAAFDLMRHALHLANLWRRWSGALVADKVGRLARQPVCDEAMDPSWTNSMRRGGIRRHHALADPRALRAGYQAIHEPHLQLQEQIQTTQGLST
ncbi:hypothetical protein VLK31_35445 [Variovorax sp. H27-G14]|uniref:hypothetical protein n=1 Tax=Variovorax sp. H27-G14 TaxID=3111914 RepID=UPI0038FD38AA